MSDGTRTVDRGSAWRSALGETDQQNRERRRAQSEIAALLRSDLYEIDHLAAEGNESYWRSPLKWVVRFQVEADTWRCVILQPDGRHFATLERPSAESLDEVLP